MPSSEATLLNRAAAAAFLKSRGYPVSPGALAVMASRGNGPAFKKFGLRRVVYSESDLLRWARSKLSPTITRSATASQSQAA